MTKNATSTDQIQRYLDEVIAREHPVSKRLREETAKMPNAVMQITPDQASCLALLVKIIGAKRIIEIGTFTGYSALAMALAMEEGGKLICCDISREWTDIARLYWQEANVASRIELRLAPATDTLKTLSGPFDMAFIDADKQGYDAYYEACLTLLRPGGLIALDNMLWSGAVADPSQQDGQTKALRALNAKIAADDRVDCSLLSVGDGLMIARKR